MTSPDATLDRTDRRIVAALDAHPRATVTFLAEQLGLARGTVQARVDRLAKGALARESLKLRAADVGRPLRAKVRAEVDQAGFDDLVAQLLHIPEVIECLGIAGADDLEIEIVAVDADDVYNITQRLMGCPGIRRTSTAVVLRELIPRRMGQLL